MSNRKGIMLATPFEEHRLERWPKPFFVQPKLDGIRCTAKWNAHEERYVLRSSEGNYITTVPHLTEQVNEFFKQTPLSKNFGLDGELYSDDLSFSDICSLVKRKVKHENYWAVQFHIFDFIHPVLDQAARFKQLEAYTLFNREWQDLEDLHIVDTFQCDGADKISYYLGQFLDDGYEGIILRHPAARYEEKRTPYMLKYKPTKQDEYEIVDSVEEMSIEGCAKGSLGALVLKGPEGSTFQCGSGPVLTKSGREELWRHRDVLVGKTCVVKYQEITTANKVPRFPVCLEIR